jgi:hypothetical protein
MRSDARRLCGLLLTVTAAGFTPVACQRTVSSDSLVDAHAAAERDNDYWDGLQTRRAMTNNDALHGLFLLADGVDPAQTYEQRLEAARQRKWIGSGDRPPADESATVGLIAVAVCDMLHVRGGLTMQVFGPSHRYCTRELVYLNIIPSRTDNQSLSGLEFLDLAGRVERRMEPVEVPPT